MKPNILVVDDEPVARQSLSEILRLEGYNVSAVPNGQAAVEHVRTHPVDLMIVDLRMPGMDGLEVIQVVNSVSPETEVVLLTAFGTTETAIQALGWVVHRVIKTGSFRPYGQTLGALLLAAGGIGNLIDRVMREGAVIDFMNMGVGSLRTGIFNIADVQIMIGVALFAFWKAPRPDSESHHGEAPGEKRATSLRAPAEQ
jgi:CheY-like chemotaxis protein